MDLFFYADEAFSGSHWFEKCYRSIQTAAAKKKYRLRRLSVCAPAEARRLIGDDRNPLIIIDTSRRRLNPTLEAFSAAGLRVVMLNFTAERTLPGVSAVVMDYQEGVRTAMRYLRAAAERQGIPGSRRIALFGVNQDSCSDALKREAFLAHGGIEADVLFNTRGLAPLCEAFAARRRPFGAVICTSDIAALALRAALRGRVRIPEDLLMISFGDMLADYPEDSVLNPGISTVTVSHETLGLQAVLLARYVYRMQTPVSATVRIVPQILPRASTARCPVPEDKPMPLREETIDADAFYDDPVVAEINAFEKCMSSVSAEDERLIGLLMAGRHRSEIARELFISESALYERIRGLCRACGVQTTGELLDLTHKYL